MTKRTRVSLVGFSLLALIFLFSGLLIFQSEASSSHKAQAGTTQLVSVSSSGELGNSLSGSPSVSADGQIVAFQSYATNLVPQDANSKDDIFVHNRLTGETEAVSVSPSGEIGTGHSRSPSISADGRFVAFESEATNLALIDTNAVSDVFVHDRSTGKTELISVSSYGEIGNDFSGSPSISADGRFVAFGSGATNLVPGDTNEKSDVFVHDRSTGETQIISVSSSGAFADGGSGSPSISADGQFVAFQSQARNLVPGTSTLDIEVFLHNRSTGETELVSVSSSGERGNQNSGAPKISGDGRFISFTSWATNLVSAETSELWTHVFVRDRLTGKTELVSISSSDEIGNRDAGSSSISADGRFVAFQSDATNLVSGNATDDKKDVFIRDRSTGETKLITASQAGEFGDGNSGAPSISADGQFVAFYSDAANLVSEYTNDERSIFVHRQDVPSIPGTPTPMPTVTPMPVPTVDPSTLTNRNYLPVIVK